MILSDSSIRERLEKGDLIISPITDYSLQIQPASVDLRLSDTFLVYEQEHLTCLDHRQVRPQKLARKIVVDEAQGILMHPGMFVLGSTAERVRIPIDLVGRVEGRSSVGRLGIAVHVTAGFIDPGFDGKITLELANLGPLPVRLYPGMRLSQLVLHTMTTPAERPYGSGRSSKYQGQREPVASLAWNDPV